MTEFCIATLSLSGLLFGGALALFWAAAKRVKRPWEAS